MTHTAIPGILTLSLALGVVASRPSPAQRSADPVLDALRRQVEREARQTEAIFARLRALRDAEPPDLIRLQAEGVILEAVSVPPAFPGGDPDEEGQPNARFVTVASRDNIDQAVFGVRRANIELVGFQLARMLDSKMTEIGRTHRLSADQVARLRLAGRGDIRRFFALVEQRRREFDGVREDLKAAEDFLSGRVRPLHRGYERGPFDEDSLLQKTLTGFGPEAPGPGARPRE